MLNRFSLQELIMDMIKIPNTYDFDTFIKTLSNYKNQISRYFIYGYSSGFVDGFKIKVKFLKRRCYGILIITRLFKRLVLDTEGMNRYAPGICAFG